MFPFFRLLTNDHFQADFYEAHLIEGRLLTTFLNREQLFRCYLKSIGWSFKQ